MLVSGIILQQTSPANETAGNQTTTEANISEALAPETIGPVGRFLRDLGIPYAETLGAIITFIVVAIVIYIVGRGIIVPLVNRALSVREVEAHARRPLLRLVRILLVFIAIGIAFGFAGYGSFLTSLATIGAAATLAIGLALQDTLSNFVAGVFIYTDRPFRIGDWVEWGGPDEGYSGIVEDITFRVTRVRTFDNELLTVPNSILTQNVIKNPVANEELRLTFTFGIGYEDDIERATEIILEEAERHPDILEEPAPTVRMGDNPLADSYVGLVARFWIANPDRANFLRTRTEYVTSVKQRFDDAGIDIPYPKLDLSGDVNVR